MGSKYSHIEILKYKNYNHKYKVTNYYIKHDGDKKIETYRLGINKFLIVESIEDKVSYTFDIGLKKILLPIKWVKMIKKI